MSEAKPFKGAPLRVAHIVRQYYPSIGGMEEVVHNIAREQKLRHGHQSKVITLDRLFKNSTGRLEPTASVDGIDIVRLSYRGSPRYPLCPQVIGQVADADVIHVHGIDFFFDYLAMTKSLHRKPLVASTHGGFFHTSFMSSLKKIYFNTITRTSSFAYDKIIATSANDGQIFSQIVDRPKLRVIENGVNVQKYRDLGPVTPTRTLIYFGRWSKNKGLEQTLSLFRQLLDASPGWKLIIAGREYDHDAAELRRLVEEKKLSDAVQIVANPDEQHLADLISQASYFICLSRHEGFGIAPIEAMSAGLTPILSDIPPFRHLIEQSGLGILVNPDAPDNTVAKLLALHETPVSDYLGRRESAQAFSSQYDWRAIADQYVDIYTQLAYSHA